jgi:hypothetical protein
MMLSTAIKLLRLPSESPGTTTLSVNPTPDDAQNSDTTIGGEKFVGNIDDTTSTTNNNVNDHDTSNVNNHDVPNDIVMNDTSTENSNTATPDNEKNIPKNDEKTTKTALRIIYDTRDDDFDIIHTHYQLLSHIQQMDANMVIYPKNPNIQSYKDLKQIPTNENDFKDHFTVTTTAIE